MYRPAGKYFRAASCTFAGVMRSMRSRRAATVSGARPSRWLACSIDSQKPFCLEAVSSDCLDCSRTFAHSSAVGPDVRRRSTSASTFPTSLSAFSGALPKSMLMVP